VPGAAWVLEPWGQWMVIEADGMAVVAFRAGAGG
jgi:hypothetical protein